MVGLARLTADETAAPAGTAAAGGRIPRHPLRFKADPPAGAFAAGPAEALARRVPGHVPAPLAVRRRLLSEPAL
ncbi:hypothetical protein HYE82_03210 [Streptomyces sp. BR123]|uniref:hypothetical protein n=1 Tax=Streptomyces sp. BR123 TaxID=2749828 RepID=UPI0015C45177|nr:hypothetical protein [Streptomyces sp. BR123]NXY93429.1 hypothetical protein [Streptomyces sp. BR123]